MFDVLYIDDEPDILELALIYFADQGIGLHTANDGEEALKFIKSQKYKIIISDARMPGVKGLDLYKSLRDEHAYDGHFILVSGHYETHESHTLPAGITRVLTKPIDFDELIVIVKDLLKA